MEKYSLHKVSSYVINDDLIPSSGPFRHQHMDMLPRSLRQSGWGLSNVDVTAVLSRNVHRRQVIH